MNQSDVDRNHNCKICNLKLQLNNYKVGYPYLQCWSKFRYEILFLVDTLHCGLFEVLTFER